MTKKHPRHAPFPSVAGFEPPLSSWAACVKGEQRAAVGGVLLLLLMLLGENIDYVWREVSVSAKG
jgi:hypothetical protein